MYQIHHQNRDHDVQTKGLVGIFPHLKYVALSLRVKMAQDSDGGSVRSVTPDPPSLDKIFAGIF